MVINKKLLIKQRFNYNYILKDVLRHILDGLQKNPTLNKDDVILFSYTLI